MTSPSCMNSSDFAQAASAASLVSNSTKIEAEKQGGKGKPMRSLHSHVNNPLGEACIKRLILLPLHIISRGLATTLSSLTYASSGLSHARVCIRVAHRPTDKTISKCRVWSRGVVLSPSVASLFISPACRLPCIFNRALGSASKPAAHRVYLITRPLLLGAKIWCRNGR